MNQYVYAYYANTAKPDTWIIQTLLITCTNLAKLLISFILPWQKFENMILRKKHYSDLN